MLPFPLPNETMNRGLEGNEQRKLEDEANDIQDRADDLPEKKQDAETKPASEETLEDAS